MTHSIFMLPSASTSGNHDSLPGEMTQTCISEGSEPVVVLPELCCSVPLTLITGHSSAK